MNSVVIIGIFAIIWISLVDAHGHGKNCRHGGLFDHHHEYHHDWYHHHHPHHQSPDSSETEYDDRWGGKSREDGIASPSLDESYGDWPDHRRDNPSWPKYIPSGKKPYYYNRPNKFHVTAMPYTPTLRPSVYPIRTTTNVPDQTEAFTLPTTIIPPVQGDVTSDSQITNCVSKCPSINDNPVCGSDGRTYNNIEHLICAQQCGVDVELMLQSSCPSDGTNLTNSPALNTDTFRAHTTQLTEHQKCMKQCRVSPEYAPVCGTDFVTYINRQRLDCAKQCGQVINVLCDQPCSACNDQPPTTSPSPTNTPVTYSPAVIQCIKRCPSTPEYNPVCGSDGVTYFNPSRLACAQICGIKVMAVKLFPCPSSFKYKTTLKWTTFYYTTIRSNLRTCHLTCSITHEFNPVCGSNGVTYKNPSLLACAKECGVSVELARNYACGANIDNSFTSESPVSSELSTNGSTIPLDLLSSVFGDFNVTTPLPITSDTDDYDLDVRFGKNNTTPAVFTNQQESITINPQ